MNIGTCSIMQPTFIPWVGYFDLIDSVDKFVFYDDVQFAKQSWQCRNRIKTSNGIIWLIVPIKKHALSIDINRVEINTLQPWIPKLTKTLYFNYHKSEYFEEVFELVNSVLLENQHSLLSTLTIELIKKICVAINIKTNLFLSSNLDCINDSREDQLIDICKKLGCDTYLSTKGSASYIEANKEGGEFSSSRVNLYYQNYNHPIYKQSYGEFVSYMSILDLLFNEGFENTLSIIRSGRGNYLTSRDLSSYE